MTENNDAGTVMDAWAAHVTGREAADVVGRLGGRCSSLHVWTRVMGTSPGPTTLHAMSGRLPAVFLMTRPCSSLCVLTRGARDLESPRPLDAEMCRQRKAHRSKIGHAIVRYYGASSPHKVIE
jgi:hypothetical protein